MKPILDLLRSLLVGVVAPVRLLFGDRRRAFTDLMDEKDPMDLPVQIVASMTIIIAMISSAQSGVGVLDLLTSPPKFGDSKAERGLEYACILWTYPVARFACNVVTNARLPYSARAESSVLHIALLALRIGVLGYVALFSLFWDWWSDVLLRPIFGSLDVMHVVEFSVFFGMIVVANAFLPAIERGVLVGINQPVPLDGAAAHILTTAWWGALAVFLILFVLDAAEIGELLARWFPDTFR